MTLLEFVLYLVIAGICGAVARALGGGGGGFLLSIVLGFVVYCSIILTNWRSPSHARTP